MAEQIAWKKARSRRIGLRLQIRDADVAMLMSGRVYGFDRRHGVWQAWKNQPSTRLAEILDDDSTDPLGDEQVREDAILCAPLVTRDGLVGLLKIAARHAEQFKAYDADLVEPFRSQAAIAIQNLHRTESLRSRVVTAERKHAMADLARSVSHDVNNALGAMLPLVQQLQEDLRSAKLEPAVLSEDGLAICCRYVPCAQLGGDLYDYAAVESGETALLDADVCGHGVSAAMLTGVVKSAFHAARADRFDPLAVVRRVWHALSPFSAQRFVTLFTALVAPAVRQLRYVNAGHPSIPLWSGGREPVWLENTGPLISPVLKGSWDARTMPVDHGDQLLLYTDGVSEPLTDADGCAKGRIKRQLKSMLGATRNCWTLLSTRCGERSRGGHNQTI